MTQFKDGIMMGLRKTLWIITLLPIIAWMVHLAYHFDNILRFLFGLYATDIMAYAYCTLAMVVIVTVLVVIFGIVKIRNIRKLGNESVVRIILILLFWIAVLILYICVLFFVDFGNDEPIGPSVQGKMAIKGS